MNLTTHYTTADNKRTAEHDRARNTLTVFEGPATLSTQDVPADITSGEIWVLIAAAEAPAEEAGIDTAGLAPWFIALLNKGEACTDRAAFERGAYNGYIAYGLSMTDGHFAPQNFTAWVTGFRKAPITELYYGNDARHDLAPQAVSYAKAKVTVLPDTPVWDTASRKGAAERKTFFHQR